MDEKKRQVWRFVIQTAISIPHGHRHGPRRDELHGSRVATAKYGAYSKKKVSPSKT